MAPPQSAPKGPAAFRLTSRRSHERIWRDVQEYATTPPQDPKVVLARRPAREPISPWVLPQPSDRVGVEVLGHVGNHSLAQPLTRTGGLRLRRSSDQLRNRLLVVGDDKLFPRGQLADEFLQPGLSLFHGDGCRHGDSSFRQTRRETSG